MKTPKRNKGNGYGAACCPFEGPNQTAFEHARWKRKNRTAQLKHTIDKLTYENAVFKQTFIQKRAFLKRLKAICREPNRSPLHRLAELDRELQMELMATKDYERKEQPCALYTP